MSELDHHSANSERAIIYSLESLVQVTGVSRDEIQVYQASGLIIAAQSGEQGEPVFDDEAVWRVRRIQFLREEQGVSLTGIRIIFELMNEVHRLREEMRFLRS